MANVDNITFRNFTYGLFVLVAKDGDKDNGCIINTGIQVSDGRISIAVNKAGLTHDMVLKTGKFNLCFIAEDAPFLVFEHFGMKSGRNIEKFDSCETENRTENGLLYLPKFINAVMSCEVIETVDSDTHTIFLADVTEAFKCSDIKSMSYSYYFDNVKPKPEAKEKKVWRCSICNYEYDGEDLPEDFICPICHHGAEVFEKV